MARRKEVLGEAGDLEVVSTQVLENDTVLVTFSDGSTGSFKL